MGLSLIRIFRIQSRGDLCRRVWVALVLGIGSKFFLGL